MQLGLNTLPAAQVQPPGDLLDRQGGLSSQMEMVFHKATAMNLEPGLLAGLGQSLDVHPRRPGRWVPCGLPGS